MIAAAPLPSSVSFVPRGSMESSAPLGALTWLRAGGRADALFRPADADDLADFLRACPPETPIVVMGAGSNTLVRDGGVRGVVVLLGSAFETIDVLGARLSAGARTPLSAVARAAHEAGLGGFEFLRGIPGTVGGALAMNAGAFGRETSDLFRGATALSRKGEVVRLGESDMGFSYRSSIAADKGFIFIEAEFEGRPLPRKKIAARMESFAQSRREAQPPGPRTGGSTFKNPKGRKAWELIQASGCTDFSVGDARLSEKHCNFLVNSGNAPAADIEALGESVRAAVKRVCGEDLEWEIRRIGDPLP